MQIRAEHKKELQKHPHPDLSAILPDKGRPATDKEAATALAKVKKFMGRDVPGLKVKAVKTNPSSKLQAVELGKSPLFKVNLDTGNVDQFLYLKLSHDASQSIDILPEEQVLASAEAFARGHFDRFADLELTSIKRPDYDNNEYTFDWRDDDTPRYVSIVVNSQTGAIFSYISNADTRTVNPKPTISEVKAINIARNKVDIFDGGTTTMLSVGYNKSGQVVLIWRIIIDYTRDTTIFNNGKKIPYQEKRSALVEVNAHSGKIIDQTFSM